MDFKFFFRGDPAPNPALLMLYNIPPGASEGVHAHKPGEAEGAADEVYYIISGRGEMQIAGERIPVVAGDNVFVPQGVPHSIENTSAEGDLKVYLIVLVREESYLLRIAAAALT